MNNLKYIEALKYKNSITRQALLQKAEHASKTNQTDQTDQTSHNIDGKYNPDVTSSYMNMIEIKI